MKFFSGLYIESRLYRVSCARLVNGFRQLLCSLNDIVFAQHAPVGPAFYTGSLRPSFAFTEGGDGFAMLPANAQFQVLNPVIDSIWQLDTTQINRA
jgi:hypothetical protein